MNSKLARFLQRMGTRKAATVDIEPPIDPADDLGGSTLPSPSLVSNSSTPSSSSADIGSSGLVAHGFDELLLEDEIDNAVLLSILRQAYLKVESTQGGRLRLTTDAGFKVYLNAHMDRSLITLAAWFALKAEKPMAEKLDFVNRANNQLILFRFAVADETTLYIEYQVSTDGGVTKASLVRLLRRMSNVIGQGLGPLDTGKVLT